MLDVKTHVKKPCYNLSGGIDCEIDHPELGVIPFTASPDDVEPLGKLIYDALIKGEAGEVGEYVEPVLSEEEAALEARTRRNQMLVDLDAIVMSPMRYAEYSESYKESLSAYRKALLDVPQQSGFPNNINWPELSS
tara:strand:+ start:204 stop:611 length:408 start_codon:yes stop_codon:yes gene_type:complete